MKRWRLVFPLSAKRIGEVAVMAASMLRDIEKNGKTEGEHIIGDMLRKARERKLQTPLLRLAYCHLQAYEARQASK